MATQNQPNFGKTKRSTDSMIDDAIAQQNSWLTRRRAFTRSFLKKLNFFQNHQSDEQPEKKDNYTSRLVDYWFPILCVFIVLVVALWIVFIRPSTNTIVKQNNVNTTYEKTIERPFIKNSEVSDVPVFDIVRVDENGSLVIAGRWLPNTNVSIVMNKKIVATEQLDNNGEFVYAPSVPLKPGNYTVSLLGVKPVKKSTSRVFLYIPEGDYKNSLSLLINSNGSTILQAPDVVLTDDLVITKIDYLSSGRIVVTGNALPRLRVSLSLNDKYIGFARVSDYKHFGLGADVGELKSGENYSIVIRLHDTNGATVAAVQHDFIMPEMTGDDDTFYTVRRGDCLWIIARNFLRRGILFSMIADRNKINNPDLIFPKQKLSIPVKNTAK